MLDPEQLAHAQEKIMSGHFTLDDFLKSMEQVSRMRPPKSMVKLVPEIANWDPDDDIRKLRGIIQSMTPDERRDPDALTPSRRVRIARGSGATPFDVDELQKQFTQMSRMMQKMSSMRPPSGWSNGGPGLG
jgi:signal recognition particle subunit SRP54